MLSERVTPSERIQAPVDANEREQQVIKLVAQGLNNREMAFVIGTSENAVKNYFKYIYDRLGVWNRLELALWYEGHHDPELVN